MKLVSINNTTCAKLPDKIKSSIHLTPQDTMMMGADTYETEAEIASLLAGDKVPIGVGRDTKIR